jgi:hypothetical protein
LIAGSQTQTLAVLGWNSALHRPMSSAWRRWRGGFFSALCGFTFSVFMRDP